MLRRYRRPTSNTKRKSRPHCERLFSLARLTSINFACLPWLRLCVHDDGRDVPCASL
jgi:hypothetical protein